MNSLFRRYMLSYGLVVILSFSLLGGAFVYQTNTLAIEEKQITLADAMQKATESTISSLSTKKEITNFLAQQALENSFRLNLMQLASYSGATIYITNAQGVIERHTIPGYHSLGDGYTSVPSVAVETLLKTDTYLDVGDFSGFLQTTNFTQGMSIKDSFGDVRYLVFVSIPAEASMRFVQNMIKT